MTFKIKDLLKGWMQIVKENHKGEQELSEEQEYLRDNYDPLSICWSGPWESDLDGLYEAQPLVAKGDDGAFYAGIQVSYMGGDCSPGWADHPYLTKDDAQVAARASLNKWHEGNTESAAENLLASWEWDGRSVHDIANHPQSILQVFPYKTKDWAHTVPEECRGKVFYVASCNPVNSLDEVHEYLEIIAIDNSSTEALVCLTTVHTYTDAEGESFVVMPVNEAKALREQFIERGKEETEKIELPADGRQTTSKGEAMPESKNCLIEKITGDNRRPGMEHPDGYLIRYRPHPSYGWLSCKTVANLPEAEAFAAKLTPEGNIKESPKPTKTPSPGM